MPTVAGLTNAVRAENLALIYQEVLTAIVRFRSNRQNITNAESFRHQMRELLKAAAQEARNRAGYASEDVRMVTLAVVGFLDESVLNAQNPLFADWPRKPLQEELFNMNRAGEVFFQDLDTLLRRDDSMDLADALEIHYLCLLLGFTGRYSGVRTGELQSIMQTVADRIRRIRGPYGDLSPNWQPGAETPRAAKDKWVRILMIGAIAAAVLTLVFFLAFKLTLDSGVSDIRTIATTKS